ncbi:uncharacterized protein C8A04DRAFT_10315 [Dichotomopilus funicola]|uniref:Cut9 interacting protein Scn1 n=1 Tax=Dichotomopilus funicola TaxID=1934379 RepID=A0AAN6V721_9PEZI|nr:hypothetical protein C8A04DRAFT_10315 [Dichotomopilus funicola]
MCHQTEDGQPASATTTPHPDHNGENDDFPWHIGVCDAHCHPTDTMSSIASIPRMRTRVLTIMATRSQDQDLVSSAAKQGGISKRSELEEPCPPTGHDRKIIPAFGWHPWFSHQIYDDTEDSTRTDVGRTYDPSSSEGQDQKALHYKAVLSPEPDANFIASLPEPLSLRDFLTSTRERILGASGPVLIGEVGLDKAFRLPWPWKEAEKSDRDVELTPGGREGRLLSPHHVRVPHQARVLRAQLKLAGELGVAASVHGVQAHGVLFEALAGLWKGHEKEVVSRRQQKMVAKGAEDFSSSEEEDWEENGEDPPRKKEQAKAYKPKPFPPRVCLHSFSGSSQTLQQYLNPAIPVKVFFSFSTAINLSTAGGESKFPEVLRACPDDRVLVESDLHCAGPEMDRLLADIARRVCEIKGWSLEQGLTRMRRNYDDFIFG